MEENKNCEGRNCKYNNGISCDVYNCYYNAEGSYCTAEKIAVGPSDATSVTDTACGTFKNKED